MKKNSTNSERKNVRLEKPSRRVINNILQYSKSLLAIPTGYGNSLMLVNN